MYKNELEIAKSLAVQAGIRIMEIYNTDFDVDYKSDESPLTKADQEANDIIIDGLKKAFPQYAILSEESKDDKSRLDNDFCFIVDPVDGTKEFVNRNGEFTVNIGLANKHKVVMGVIYVPVVKELYSAAQGDGAWLQKFEGITVEELKGLRAERLEATKKVSELVLVGSKSHASDKLKALIEEKQDLIVETKSAGSSLKGCLIAKGEADVYYRFGYTCEWDTSAMQCIAEEAGCIFRQMDGSEMMYNREDNLDIKVDFSVYNSYDVCGLDVSCRRTCVCTRCRVCPQLWFRETVCM